MRQLFQLLLIASLISSCQKEEGLSKNTGNLEIKTTLPTVYQIGEYLIYTKAEYNNYLENGSYPNYIRMGNPGKNSVSEKGLEAGIYILKAKIYFYNYSCIKEFEIEKRKSTSIVIGP